MNEPILFTLSDLKELYLRHQRQIHRAMIVCGVALFCFLLLAQVEYLAEATFKQATFKQTSKQETGFLGKDAVEKLIGSKEDKNALAILQSNEVIRDVVQELGLQATCSEGIIRGVFRRVKEAFQAEFRCALAPRQRFVFRGVEYGGETTASLLLTLSENGDYQLHDRNRQLLGSAKMGKPIVFGEGKLVLLSAPESARIGKEYVVKLQPLMTSIERTRKKLKIQPFKLDKSMLKLTFLHRDRHLGAEFVNRLMQNYQQYLKKENDAICQVQLDFLQKRQEDLVRQYDLALKEHAAYLNENLVKSGFMGFEQGIETLSQPKNAYSSKLLDLDLELRRLETPAEADGAGQEPLPGLSLTTAQGLLVEYTRQREALQTQRRECVFLSDQLNKPDFEMSSIGDVSDDKVIKEIVNAAAEVSLQLKDEHNRSTKEQERLSETLQTQKNFLAQHLQQTIELKQIRINRLTEKIASLQRATHSLLQAEKTLLGGKLHELNSKMQDLPDKWRHESLLSLKKELGSKVVQGISQLFETKFLDQQTFPITSRPLDPAIPRLRPQPPHLFLLSICFALLGGGVCYGWFFSQAFIRGFPVSESALKLAGMPLSGVWGGAAGSLDALQDTDLQTLRHAVAFVTRAGRGSAVLCLAGKHSPFYSLLAELLSLQGLKVLVMDCSFHSDEEQLGLWDYLRGHCVDLPIKQGQHYDFVSKGKEFRYAPELARRSEFDTLLNTLKERYDVVLLHSDVEPASAERFSLLERVDAAVVAVQKETQQELAFYAAKCVAFLLVS